MAIATYKLITALRNTAKKLEEGGRYQWGHMGHCNCGNLVQELTGLSGAEIHRSALRTRQGDWATQAIEYCPTSKLPMDEVIESLLRIGLTLADIKNLERLSDRSVLKRFPVGKRYLNRHSREDVILYLNEWANMLAEQLPAEEIHANSADKEPVLVPEARVFSVI